MLLLVKAMVGILPRGSLHLLLSVGRSHGMRWFSLRNPPRCHKRYRWECWEAIARTQGKSNQV